MLSVWREIVNQHPGNMTLSPGSNQSQRLERRELHAERQEEECLVEKNKTLELEQRSTESAEFISSHVSEGTPRNKQMDFANTQY